MKPTLGFIGLGMMGAPMALRLINAGYTVHVFNRSKEKAGAVIERGAIWNNSPADVARNADVVFSMLTNDEVLKNISSAIQPNLRAEGIHIDCSTVSPAVTASLEKEYFAGNKFFLHSPVLGSIPQATDGSLLLFVGGNNDAFLRSEFILKVLGQKIWRFPKAEQASHVKLIMNSFIAGMIATLSQALMYAQKAEVSGTTMLDVLNHSALNATMYQTKGASILQNNFTPRFFLENLLKDANLFRETAQSLSVSTPIADTVKSMLDEAIRRGLGKEDYSAIVKVL